MPVRLRPERLEDRLAPAAPFTEFIDPNPSPGNRFGELVVVLGTGNVVVTSPGDDAAAPDAGAVYLFNGATGALISTLRGSSAGDRIGSLAVWALESGNYVVVSPLWNNGAAADAGAVTFGNGTTGVSGPVSVANSLVGTTAGDQLGTRVVPLPNGNYVVGSPLWDNGPAADAGAATFGSGTTGVTGPVSAANSLVGTTAEDQVGNSFAFVGPGNYLVLSALWNNGGVMDAGAATFGNGTTGVTGPVSAANSLVGSTANDRVGSGNVNSLTNGNYVVASPRWDNGGVVDAGAVTFGNGTTGVTGPVTAANSLVGSTANDQVGINGASRLTNGNYVVRSFQWDNGGITDAGAVTFGSGITGVTGPVSAANSLVGTTANDQIGSVTALPNGNYVVSSLEWDNGAAANVGAVTYANGTTGVTGPITAANSLVGTSANDRVGTVEVLTNGNYVVVSPSWNNGAVADVGAVTFANGTTGLSGPVTSANSLVGTTANDRVGGDLAANVLPLTNGNYLVGSPSWNNGGVVDAGAATLGNGTTGLIGTVTVANSLVGTSANDQVGLFLSALPNGNYVVQSPEWNNGGAADAGAVTFGNGTTGVTGPVSAANSLVGSSANDRLGVTAEFHFRVRALTNGNYVVGSPLWNNGGVADAGAVTFGNGTTGVTGPVSAANSLVGTTANDQIGSLVVRVLDNGNYTVSSPLWNNGAAADAGAVTFGNGTTGVTGPVTRLNSAIGLTANTGLDVGIPTDPVNGTFFASFRDEGGGRVRAGSQTDGFVPNVRLSVSAAAGTEAAATVITVTATASSPVTGDATVGLAVTGAGITAGDFILSSSTITIPHDQTSGSVTFTVVNDARAEGDETATVSVASLSANLVPRPPVSQTITIASEDRPALTPLVASGPTDGTAAVFAPTAGVLPATPTATVAAFGAVPVNVRAAAADVNGDGVFDTVLVTGPGTPIRVAVVSGRDNTTVLVAPFDPFGGNFPGGGFAAAGDFDLDGRSEFVVTPDQGGGPRVTVFALNLDGTTSVRANFFGIDDDSFRGGARAAVGDVNGDAVPDVAVAAGFLGGPRTALFDGKTLQATPTRLINDFFAFPGPDAERLRNGAYVAAGDVDGDGFAELIFGGGPGGAPRVFVLSGALVSAGNVSGAQAAPVGNFFVAGNDADRGGVRVAAADLDGDQKADVIAGSGEGRPAGLRAYLGRNVTTAAEPAAFQDVSLFGGGALAGGVFVG